MKTVHKSVLIWYSPAEMYALVNDVASYPKFLPWCDQARVVEQFADQMTAEVGIAFMGIRQRFTTRNTLQPDRQIAMQLVNGPFSQLDGTWDFLPVADGQQRACKIEFALRYGFSNMALGALVGPVFDRIAGSFVDAFVQRAEVVYA